MSVDEALSNSGEPSPMENCFNEDLLDTLKREKFELVLAASSDTSVKTGRLLQRKNKKVRLLVENELKDMNLGIFKGLTVDEIKEKYPAEWEKRNNDLYNYKVPKGESMVEVKERVKRVLDKILKMNRDTLIVASSTVNLMICMCLLGTSMKEVNANFSGSYLTVFNIKGGNIETESLGVKNTN